MTATAKRGFSLMEFVVVIVIAAVLAMVAIPYYLKISDEAKKSSIEALAAGFSSAVIATRSQWEVRHRPKQISGQFRYNQVHYDGVDFWLTDKSASEGVVNGYPLVTSQQNQTYPMELTSDMCVDLLQNLLQKPPKVAVLDSEQVRHNSNKYDYLAIASERQCVYYQQHGLEHAFHYDISSGQVLVALQE